MNIKSSSIAFIFPTFSLVMSIVNQVSGTWNINFPAFDLGKFIIKGGKITLGGQTITLTFSTNSKFPTAKGWLCFTLKGRTYYVKITTSGIRMGYIDKQGFVVRAYVTQGGTSSGKYFMNRISNKSSGRYIC